MKLLIVFLMISVFQITAKGFDSDMEKTSGRELPKDIEHVMLQQAITITGTVTDVSGDPLPGATVIIKGTTQGTTTDANGLYSLTIPDANAVLLVSFVGYASQEVTVGNRRSVNITLSEDARLLEEVVVIGYGSIKKTSLTGAVTDIKAAEIAATPTTNLSNILAGRAPGVTFINNSGFVGASSSIRIRGKGTWNNQSVLYVIDDVVQEGQRQFDALDPNEVESISFLKDAATTAIYGSRASNGVVLVKTKTGFYNRKPSLTYTGAYTTERPTRPLPLWTAQEEVQNTIEYAEYMGNPFPYTEESYNYLMNDIGKGYEMMDYIWQNPWSHQHNISINGGSEKITYFAGVGLNENEGSFRGVKYDRYNFRSNVSALVNDYITVNVNISGNQQNSDRWYWPYDDWNDMTLSDFYRSTIRYSVLRPYYVDVNGNPLRDRNAPGALAVSGDGFQPGEMIYSDSYRHTKWRQSSATGRIDVKIPGVEGLKARAQYNYQNRDYNTKSFVSYAKHYRYQPKDALNPNIPGPVDLNDIVYHNLGNTYENIQEMLSYNNEYQLQLALTYDRTFGEHSLSALGLYEVQKNTYKYLNGQANQLLSSSVDQFFNASNAAGMRTINGNESVTGRAAWVGRLHYEYSSRYILEFAFRYDGSDRFPKDKRWGFFPTGSFAWRISEEDFFNVPFISSLKLRGSVGMTGDDQVSRFQYQNSYVTSGSYVFGDQLYNGMTASAPPNPNITWEKALLYDIGLDFGLFGGILTGEAGYYYQKRWDILMSRIRQIPTTFGTTPRNENYAKVDNWGSEFSLFFNNSIGELTYQIGANMGYSNNKVVYIDEAVGLEPWRSAIGHPIDYVWGLKSLGIIRDQAKLDALPAGFTQFGRAPRLGALLYEDNRGENRSEGPDGKIDDNDRLYLSRRAIPRINYGVSLSAQWRGVYFDALFQGVGGYDRFVKTLNTDGVFQSGAVYFKLWLDNWTPEDPNAKYPALGGWLEEYGATGSTFWLRKGAYCRLKNLNIGYSLPQKWIEHLKMEELKIYLNGTNLFDISGKWNEMDPEQERLDSYPVMKSYSAGISITF